MTTRSTVKEVPLSCVRVCSLSKYCRHCRKPTSGTPEINHRDEPCTMNDLIYSPIVPPISSDSDRSNRAPWIGSSTSSMTLVTSREPIDSCENDTTECDTSDQQVTPASPPSLLRTTGHEPVASYSPNQVCMYVCIDSSIRIDAKHGRMELVCVSVITCCGLQTARSM